MVYRSNPRFSLNVVWSLAVALLGALGLAGTARAGGHFSFADFQAGARGDLFLQSFGGSFLAFMPAQDVSSQGYAYNVSTVQANPLCRSTHGIGPQSVGDTGVVTFSGGPVTAFGATFFAENNLGVAMTGSIGVLTDTGETYTFSVPETGAFIGITSSRPFNTIRFFRAATGFFMKMDNVYVGVSGSASTPTDRCTDAPTVASIGDPGIPTTSFQIPFSTAGATAEFVPGSCSGIDSGPDVWVRYVASWTGSVTITTCGCTFDSILRVFDSCGGSQIACNDDACDSSAGLNRASRVQFRIVAGTAYLVRISGFSGESGAGVLAFSATRDCASDFNHSGQANVQDIFDYLTAWFAGCP